MEKGMENMQNQPSAEDKGREMMVMPDGTMADVTNMTPEEKRELLDSYTSDTK